MKKTMRFAALFLALLFAGAALFTACAEPSQPSSTTALPDTTDKATTAPSDETAVPTETPDTPTPVTPTPTETPVTPTPVTPTPTETPVTPTPVTPTPTETPVTPTPVTPTPVTPTPVTPTPTETPDTPTPVTPTPVTPTPTETPVTPTPVTPTPVTPTPTETPVTPTPVTPTPTETPVTPTPVTPTPTETPDTPTPVDPNAPVAVYDLSLSTGDNVKMYVYKAPDADLYTALIDGEGYMREIAVANHPWAEFTSRIREARVKGGVKNVMPRLFTTEEALEKVIVEPGVVSIGMDAFAYCGKLKTIYIPETVGEIGQGFVYSSGVNTVYLGYTSFQKFYTIATQTNYNFEAVGGHHGCLDEADYLVCVHEGDENDGIDRSRVQEIDSQNRGYGNILRVKTSQDLLFSPDINCFRRFMQTAEFSGRVSDYTARLVICAVDGNGRRFYTFPTLFLPLQESKGDWFDVFLQGTLNGKEVDVGFCPQPGRTYEIHLEILDPSGKVALFRGGYDNIKVGDDVFESKYFKSRAIPGEENLLYRVEYIVRDGTGGHIEGDAILSLPFGAQIPPVTAVPDEGYMLLQWSDGSTEPTRTGDTVKGDIRIYADFIKDYGLSTIADLYITTDTGKPILSKSYVTGTAAVSGGDGSYSLDAVTMQVRGRGNSSWSGAAQDQYDSKNSYKLKLDEKEGLFGMPAAKKWVLNSNKFDAPGLRSWSMWTLADLMGTIPYSPRSTFVNLYVNGVYRGLYTLSEQIEIKSYRVDVTEQSDDGDVGFLIELDFRGDGDSGAIANETYFTIPAYASNVEFVIKNDVTSKELCKQIKAVVSRCSQALMSGDRETIDRYVDIPSLIDMYIIEEFSKDVDVGAASFFIQRDPGGKLYFTAPWDFDFGFGTYGPGTSTDGFRSSGTEGCAWYRALIKQEWFREEVLSRMKELDREVMPEFYEKIYEQAEILEAAGDRNARFWNMYGNHFHGYVASHGSTDVYSYMGYVNFMTDWMKTRWAWMEEHMLEANTY